MLVDQTGCKKLHLSDSSILVLLYYANFVHSHTASNIFFEWFFFHLERFDDTLVLVHICHFYVFFLINIWYLDWQDYLLWTKTTHPFRGATTSYVKTQLKGLFMASLYLTKRSVCIQLGMQIRHLESCSNKFNFYFLLTSVRDALVCLIVTRLLFVIVAHIEMASPGT